MLKKQQDAQQHKNEHNHPPQRIVEGNNVLSLLPQFYMITTFLDALPHLNSEQL